MKSWLCGGWYASFVQIKKRLSILFAKYHSRVTAPAPAPAYSQRVDPATLITSKGTGRPCGVPISHVCCVCTQFRYSASRSQDFRYIFCSVFLWSKGTLCWPGSQTNGQPQFAKSSFVPSSRFRCHQSIPNYSFTQLPNCPIAQFPNMSASIDMYVERRTKHCCGWLEFQSTFFPIPWNPMESSHGIMAIHEQCHGINKWYSIFHIPMYSMIPCSAGIAGKLHHWVENVLRGVKGQQRQPEVNHRNSFLRAVGLIWWFVVVHGCSALLLFAFLFC